MIAGVEVKNSNCEPTRSISIRLTFTASDMRKGGRKTLNPEAAARLIPMNAAITIPASSTFYGGGGVILTRTRN